MHGFRFGNDARKNVSCEAGWLADCMYAIHVRRCMCCYVYACVYASVVLVLMPIEFSYIHTVRVYICGSRWSALNGAAAAAARTLYKHIVFDAETF